MTKKQILLYLAISSLLTTTVVYAEEPADDQSNETVKLEVSASNVSESTLDRVVVTATKTEVNRHETKADITIVTKEEIEQRNYENLEQVLRDVPGVNISKYASGNITNRLYIQGTNQVVFLIDGVRVTVDNGGNGFPFEQYVDLDGIEKIEILKGAASTLYGSDAKGGVINLITKKSPDKKTSFSIAGGNNNYENYKIYTQGTENKFSWFLSGQKSLSGDYKDGHGKRVISRNNTESINLKLTQEFSEGTDLSLFYQRYEGDYDRTDSSRGWNSGKRIKGSLDYDRVSLIYNQKINDKFLAKLSLYRNKNEYNDDKTNIAFSRWLMDLESRGVQVQLDYRPNDKHIIIGGFDFNEDKIKNYDDSWDRFGDKNNTNRAFYIQDDWKIGKKFTLTYGVRTDNHSLYGTESSPSINLGYKANDKTNYYVAYKEFFVAPNAYQLYSSYGNQRLKAEDGHNVEIGLNHKFNDSFTANLNFFKRDSENVVGYNFVTNKYDNITEEDAKGFSVSLNKRFSDKISGFVGYTYTKIDSYKTTAENINGLIPKGMWNIAFTFEKEKYDVSLIGRGIIDKPGAKNGTDKIYPTDTYWVCDVAANFKVDKHATLFVRVNNIFDKYYAEFSNVGPYGGGPGDWWSAPGRNYQIGVKCSF
ncbi:TonB-dependent receptor [Selenomonadales bacterium OttesenSCG-928-I06]|nr:TonB-dependent receptor [Selenomonadales bacterium OttesenSCG-928-I06]